MGWPNRLRSEHERIGLRGQTRYVYIYIYEYGTRIHIYIYIYIYTFIYKCCGIELVQLTIGDALPLESESQAL